MSVGVDKLVHLECFFDGSRKKKEKYSSMDCILEGKKDKKCFSYKAENPLYNPAPRPAWCKKLNKKLVPCIYCLGTTGSPKSCPHLVASVETRVEEAVALHAVEKFLAGLSEKEFDAMYARDCKRSNAEYKRVLAAEGFEERNGFIVKKGSRGDPAARWMKRNPEFKKALEKRLK